MKNKILPTIFLVIGTRPEAIKIAPVIHALKMQNEFRVIVIATGQHSELLSQVLEIFKITPDINLKIMEPKQDLVDITTKVMTGLQELINQESPDLVVVHGDTTTAMAATLAAFLLHIPVAHVEAGLRTGNVNSPWPEEINRVLTARMASLHFPPTEAARTNLLIEKVDDKDIEMTGNTVIDSLIIMRNRIENENVLKEVLARKFSFINSKKRLVLITAHRRENFGSGIINICASIEKIASRNDVQIIYPVHPNPKIQEPVYKILKNKNNIYLIKPLDYLEFVYIMSICHFVMTDSGGIQEEAPGLGKPVLILRNTTERPEAITAGTALLVGTNTLAIVKAANKLLDNEEYYHSMAHASNPFGDGKSGEKIARRIKQFLENQIRNINA